MNRSRKIMDVCIFCAVVLAAAAITLTHSPAAHAATGRQNGSQETQSGATTSAVPTIIQFSGEFSGTAGGSVAVPSGTTSITFTLYEAQQGGAALWSETQNVKVDAQGHYTALLGSTSPNGLPVGLFTSGQAHWLAVQPLGQDFAEQPRVLLVSAPYALKAGDAETIGGLPPSAFVRVDASSGASGTIAGTSAGTTTATTASKGSAHAKPVRLSTTQCGDFCNAGTGYQIGGTTIVATPGGVNGGNTALGISALSVTQGGDNTAVGALALALNTNGADNTAIGLQALEFNTTGIGNTASGLEALWLNTTGSANTASGNAALQNNSTASNNTAVGFGALGSNTTGSPNTAIGYDALVANTTGGANTASGYQALYGNTTGTFNTASGYVALEFNTTGSDNTASGTGALLSNTTGTANTASGQAALISNTTASNNTAMGFDALGANTTGSPNTAIGYEALVANTTGNFNTASGTDALVANTTGTTNTADGDSALQANTTGNNNIAIGHIAAINVSGANSNNIEIGSDGSFNDNNVIRIGNKGTQKKFFVAGVSGVTVGSAVPVMIDSITGQLGTVSSSRRYKEDIHDMGDSSEKLMRLRPVTFRYKQSLDDGSKPIQYGLIAEEVAEVYPDMVARSADGQIETVKYQLLDPMLLNEIQRQQTKIRDLQDRLKTQQAEIAELVSSVTTIQASLHSRHRSGAARLASARIIPAPATTSASLAVISAAQGGN